MVDRRETLHALFGAALEQPAADRAAWLERSCQAHPELANELRAMLHADAEIGGVLDVSVDEVAAYLGLHRPRGREGERIGPFTLVALLGKGGMGEVYRADRTQGGFEQTVALKVMRIERVDAAAQARFLLERRILARLTHPHIAHFVDGGIAAHGEPWFAMEYVAGEPLLEWCNSRALPIGERLRLLLDVCAAVESAHRYLIIHRDIKPGNVLVDADGQVKLLDFGIAKLLENDGALEAPTGAHARLLTPEYATPEQVRGDPVTTATDIHALALLMYELLCGRRAFGSRSSSPFDVQREVLEDEPAPMASALKAGAATNPDAIARQRGVDVAALGKFLRGDLQRIVSKAVRKEPEQRYRSVAAFADDVRRYLGNRPVEAAGGARVYRAQKFLRRHRFAVAAAAVIVIAVLAGLLGTTMQAHRARVQAMRADDERRTAVATRDFLIAAFKAAGPDEALGKPVTPRQLIDDGARRARATLSTEPALQVEFFDALGEIYMELGDRTAAERIGRDALAIAASRLGDAATLTDATRVDLATALVGRDTADDARATEAMTLLNTVVARSEDSVESRLLRAKALTVRGALQDQLNQTDDGQHSFAAAVDEARSLGTAHEVAVADALVAWGGSEERNKRCPSAIPHFREALALRLQLFDPNSPAVAGVRHELALCLDDEGHAAEAEQLLREVEASERQTLGETHPEYANTLNSLGSVLIDTGKNAEAEKLLQKALTIFEMQGEESDSAAEVLNSLSVLRSYELDYQTAGDLERQALAIWEKRHGPTYDYALVAKLNLAMYRFQRGDIAGAQTDFLALRDLRARAKLPADTSVSAYLSAIERASGFPAKAKPWAEESVALATAANGATSIDALQAREELAVVERDLSDWAAARKDVQFALDNFIASGGPQQPNLVRLRFLLAQIDYEESHCERAQPVFEETAKRFTTRTDLDSVQQASAAQLLDGLCKQALHDTSTPSSAELIEAGRSKLLASGHAEPYLVNLARQAKVK